MESCIRVEHADVNCISSWLELVKRVADCFPGLVLDDYTEVLRRNIMRGTALCVRDGIRVVGALLYSPRQHCLSWMAVAPEYRRRGVASALISEMLRCMPDGDISVTTFRVGDPKALAPRSLYAKFGFEPDALLVEYGYPVQRMVLHR